jgi:hypothetical protein
LPSKSIFGKFQPNSLIDPASWTTPNYRRPLHWVVKVSSLEATLDFFKSFDMKVLRHEVNGVILCIIL